MKKATMFVGALLLVAAPLYAYVQPASLMRASLKGASKPANLSTTLSGTQTTVSGVVSTADAVMTESITGGDGFVDVYQVVAITEDSPTRPVPEPGTMAMASMGLLALGFAVRRKFGS